MMGFVADFGSLLGTVLSFLLALGIIVAVHEYGHYIIGRLSGIKAEVFSLGFGPVIAARMDRHGTRWQLAAIPLGGFVRFKGDKDAASAQAGDTAGMTASEARQTMAGAPLWARAATVAAGPVFNFVLAFVIFVSVVLVSGLQSDRAVVGTAFAMPQGQVLQQGDEVLAIDGVAVTDMASAYAVAANIAPKDQITYTLRRDEQTLQVQGPHPFPPRAAYVHLQNAAFDAGILAGDVIVEVNERPIFAFSQVQEAVLQSAGAPVALRVWREGQGEMDLTLTPLRRDFPLATGGFETRWTIGISSSLAFGPEVVSASLWEAARIGAVQLTGAVTGTFSGLAHMIRGEISTCNLSGPVGLASTMGDAARTGLDSFVLMLAMVSIGVGILNLLPVPVLDGGHLMFFAYEAVTRRKPSAGVMNVAVMVGLFFVAALTLFALSNDLTCA